ncbi:MAG: hypothetical protein B7X57_08600 [Erythrobacter sp. 34-65-8]|nr:MAG: hypothetical protein B7X57_08600 [Erythrobacter sp. 34-65-8]
MSIVDPVMSEQGWTFTDGAPDSVNGAAYLHQVYTRARPDYSGRVTVPVLWDRQQQTIVNNESSEILRLFNSAFDQLTGNHDDYCPADLQGEIERLNRLYSALSAINQLIVHAQSREELLEGAAHDRVVPPDDLSLEGLEAGEGDPAQLARVHPADRSGAEA